MASPAFPEARNSPRTTPPETRNPRGRRRPPAGREHAEKRRKAAADVEAIGQKQVELCELGIWGEEGGGGRRWRRAAMAIWSRAWLQRREVVRVCGPWTREGKFIPNLVGSDILFINILTAANLHVFHQLSSSYNNFVKSVILSKGLYLWNCWFNSRFEFS